MNDDMNFSDMLNEVMSDPQKMQQIIGVAQKVMGDSSAGASASAPAPVSDHLPDGSAEPASLSGDGIDPAKIAAAMNVLKGMNIGGDKPHSHGKNEDKIRLISALIPFLGEKRRETAKTLIRVLQLMQAVDLDKLLKG